MLIHVLPGPNGPGIDSVRPGTTRQGKQRDRRREHRWAGRTFLLDYSSPGQASEVKQQIVDLAMNASGMRDTARVLPGSTNTVMQEVKNRKRSSTMSIRPSWRP